MKKLVAVSIVFCVGIFMGATAQAAGVCMQVVGSCNSYYFTTSQETPDTLSIHGYEYGCGNDTRLATGVVRINGGTYYIGFTGTNHQFDYTQTVAWNAEVNAQDLTGAYDVLFTYMNGGALTAHGASGTVTVTLCADPAALTETGGEDTSLYVLQEPSD